MHALMTASSTTVHTRIGTHARYAVHCGIRSDEMTLVMLTASPPRKRVPAKVMWYAPIIPRLKRLFRNEEHTELMRWHSENRKKDGKLRAPADGSQWRKIERKYWDEFAKDPRNVWFAFSADGINPFGEQSSNHST